MKYGDRVEILHSHYKVPNTLVGRTGVVKSVYTGNVAVKVDGLDNPRSGYGYFYFKEKQLKKLKEDSKEMSNEKVMEGNYRIADVRFIDGNNDKTYKYACYDSNIVVGDICVVKSANHGFGIAEVINFEPKTEERITREIVCVADFGEYYAREFARKRKKELRQKMANRAAQLQEIAMYAILAKEDSEMQTLLSEFEVLNNG